MGAPNSDLPKGRGRVSAILWTFEFLKAMHFILFSMVGVANLSADTKQPPSMYRETLRYVHQPDEFLSWSWALQGGSADYHFIQQFSYQWNGQNQYFSYSIPVNSYCQNLFCYGGLLHYQIALRSTSYILCGIHVMRTTRLDAETGRFCRSQGAAKCGVQQRPGKLPINNTFVEAWKQY